MSDKVHVRFYEGNFRAYYEVDSAPAMTAKGYRPAVNEGDVLVLITVEPGDEPEKSVPK